MMRNWVRTLLERWGEDVSISCKDGAPRTTKALIQPVSERREGVPESETPVGWTDERLWLYVGLDELHDGDTLCWRDLTFRVRSGRGFFLGGALCHWQAVLEQERGAL